MQQHSVYLVCKATHSWTLATVVWQLATTLTDADDNFTHQIVDPGIELGPVCTQRVVVATAGGTGRLGILLPARTIVS